MAKQTCGKTTVDVDARCSWVCNCLPGKPCDWTVSCPDGMGGWISTTGTGLTTTPPRHPTIKVAGNLAGIAICLTRAWKRPVTVPEGPGRKKIERTLKGTPEEIAHALGLKLG
jgi:hypothetical protein